MGYRIVRAFGVVVRKHQARRGGVLPSLTSRWTVYDNRATPTTRRFLSSSSDDNTDDDNDDDTKKKRVVFLGTPEVAADTLRSMYEDSISNESSSEAYKIVGVVTQPPKRRKRKGKVVHSPVGIVAEELGIPILCPEKARDADFLDELQTTMKPDLCVTAAYGQYLPKRFLATPKYGTLNIHPSLLPKWRGASPVQRSLEAGENPVGVSVLFTVSKMDAGPIVAQEEVFVDDETDQATTVLPRLFQIGTTLLLEQALPGVLNGTVTMEQNSIPQKDDEATSAKMIDASEAELKVWKESAQTCHNRMRGFSMWPGTFLFIQIGDETDVGNNDGPTKVKLVETRVLADLQEKPTKEIEIGPSKKSLRLVCGDGSVLEILKLQPVTRKVMDARSFINGLQGRAMHWVKPDPEEKESAEDADGGVATTPAQEQKVAAKS